MLNEQSSLDRLLGLKIATDLKWNSYIAEVGKQVSKMMGSFYRSSKMLTPEAILYLYNSQVRPKMEYCAYIWTGASKASLSVLDRLQHSIEGLVGEELFPSLQPLSHRTNVASVPPFLSTVITTGIVLLSYMS